MVIDVGIQVILVKLVDQRCPALRNMTVSKVFPDDRTIFGLDQGVVIGLVGRGRLRTLGRRAVAAG